MSTSSTTIPRETARHVLWTFACDGGYQPGSFTQKLLELLASADIANTAKIGIVYPAEAEAVRMAKNDLDGLAKLQAIATGQAALACTCGNTAGPFDLQGRCETCTRAAA